MKKKVRLDTNGFLCTNTNIETFYEEFVSWWPVLQYNFKRG